MKLRDRYWTMIFIMFQSLLIAVSGIWWHAIKPNVNPDNPFEAVLLVGSGAFFSIFAVMLVMAQYGHIQNYKDEVKYRGVP